MSGMAPGARRGGRAPGHPTQPHRSEAGLDRPGVDIAPPTPGRTRAADLVALEDQLLAVLRDAAGFPLSTRQVADPAGPSAWPPDGVTWRRLDRMARAGRVERVKLPGCRQVWWRASGSDGG